MTQECYRQAATPQVTMVNGEIVLDPSSLSYSAPSTPRQEIVEVVHEEKNENLVDKNVKRKRKGIPKQWTQQEEELLYEVSFCFTRELSQPYANIAIAIQGTWAGLPQNQRVYTRSWCQEHPEEVWQGMQVESVQDCRGIQAMIYCIYM